MRCVVLAILEGLCKLFWFDLGQLDVRNVFDLSLANLVRIYFVKLERTYTLI